MGSEPKEGESVITKYSTLLKQREVSAFHGTTFQFSKFDPLSGVVNDSGYLGAGSYFSEDKSEAIRYADMAKENAPGTPFLYSVSLKIRHPFSFKGSSEKGTYGMPREKVLSWTEALKKKGFTCTTNGYGEWCMFYSQDIEILESHSISRKEFQEVYGDEYD